MKLDRDAQGIVTWEFGRMDDGSWERLRGDAEALGLTRDEFALKALRLGLAELHGRGQRTGVVRAAFAGERVQDGPHIA